VGRVGNLLCGRPSYIRNHSDNVGTSIDVMVERTFSKDSLPATIRKSEGGGVVLRTVAKMNNDV
jgi:hypothetical protein